MTEVILIMGAPASGKSTLADEYIRKDLQAYKFDEYLKNTDDLQLAAACSALNILAHQVTQEIKLYQDGLKNNPTKKN